MSGMEIPSILDFSQYTLRRIYEPTKGSVVHIEQVAIDVKSRTFVLHIYLNLTEVCILVIQRAAICLSAKDAGNRYT